MSEKAEATKKIIVLSPAFYTLQATVCEEWALEFKKKSDICLGWSELLKKASSTNSEWINNYEAWAKTFLNQSKVCDKQAIMAHQASSKVIL
jgi:hypothetical protein